MDEPRFDASRRMLATKGSRRSAVSLGLAGVLSIGGAPAVSGRKRAQRCTLIRIHCGACGRCKRGRCVPVENWLPCGIGNTDGEYIDGACIE